MAMVPEVIRMKNPGYRPLTHGLLDVLEPHIDLDMLKDYDGLVDGQKVLSMFVYDSCNLNNDEDCNCVCGHHIKNLFWIKAPEAPKAGNTLVGICCVKKFTTSNPLLVRQANDAEKREKYLKKVKDEPDSRCVCCGKKRLPEGRILHSDCRTASTIPTLLEMARQTPFILSLKKRSHFSPKQLSALVNPKFWPTSDRIAVYKHVNGFPQ